MAKALEPDAVERHRTVPIRDTIDRIPGYPRKLVIFKIPASHYWWVRYFADNKVFKRTTKSEIKADAVRAAKRFFNEINYRLESGRLPLDPAENPAAVITFDAMAARLITSEEGKLQRGELTKISFDNLVYRMNKTILPHFKGKDVRSVNYALLNEYLTKLSGQKESLSLSTIGAYMGLVRKVLLHAVRESHLDQVPEFPKVGVEDRPRGWFRVAEYSLLYRTAKKLAYKTIEWRAKSQEEGSYYCLPGRREHPDDRLIRRIEISPDLNDVIVFMVNSYIRPTDLKHMQHRHVQVVRREFTYLRLTLPPSKGHSFPITTMPWAVKVYERIRARRLKASGGKDIPINEYVFYPEYPNRDYALKQIQRQFEVLLAVTGLRVKGVKEQDNDRTLYSLRHSSIMFRLLYGQAIDTLTLARNARTSPEMIDRFYAAPLQGEMNIDKLQSKRRPRPWEVGQRINNQDQPIGTNGD